MRTKLLVVALVFAAGMAGAQPKGAEAEARAFFEVGAKAYKAGKYADAIHSFEQGFRRAQRAGLAFSLGQSHRMQYLASGSADNLREAVRYYRVYLEKDPNGKRKSEVLEALESLVPQLEKLGAEETTPTAPAAPKKPRVMIATQTPGAVITFDGKPAGDYFASEVEVGKHAFSVSAPGFVTQSREIVVESGKELPPFSIDLQEKPAFIVVRAPEGAAVSLDGRIQGESPLPPLEVKPGVHFVAVTLNGHEAFTRELEVSRGEKARVDVELDTTTQRSTSWVLMGIGAGGILAGGVLGAIALRRESQANDILDASYDEGNLPPSELGSYEGLRSERDDFRLAALITGGAGVVVGATGLVLHLFDEPRVRAPELREKPKREPGAPRPGAPSMELSAAPVLTPSFAGGGVVGRF